ncbi:unnamed protein product, partial [Ectocarpus fasciculatus]
NGRGFAYQFKDTNQQAQNGDYSKRQQDGLKKALKKNQPSKSGNLCKPNIGISRRCVVTGWLTIPTAKQARPRNAGLGAYAANTPKYFHQRNYSSTVVVPRLRTPFFTGRHGGAPQDVQHKEGCINLKDASLD